MEWAAPKCKQAATLESSKKILKLSSWGDSEEKCMKMNRELRKVNMIGGKPQSRMTTARKR